MATEDWNEIMRKAIRDSGLTLYRIAKDADLDVAPLQRFMEGKHGMTLETAAKIGPVVGVKLTRRKGK